MYNVHSLPKPSCFRCEQLRSPDHDTWLLRGAPSPSPPSLVVPAEHGQKDVRSGEVRSARTCFKKKKCERKLSRSRSKFFKKFRPLKRRPVKKGCHWSGLSCACLVTLTDIESDLHALWKAVASAFVPAAGGHDAEDAKDQERLEITGNVGHGEKRLAPKQQSHYRTATSHSLGDALAPGWSVKLLATHATWNIL